MPAILNISFNSPRSPDAAQRNPGLLIRALALLLSSLGSTLVLAEPPQREHFGYQWPLQLQSQSAAHRVLLTEAVYARISRPDLRDLAAFNAAGDSIPLGPVPLPPATRAGGDRFEVTVSWFALPEDVRAAGADAVRLHIERGADGKLLQLHTDIEPMAAASTALPLLLDLHAGDEPAEQLDLDFTRGNDDIRARFRVSGSNDLDQWNVLVDSASVLDLRQGEFQLQRRRIKLPTPSHYDYLLLTRLDDGPALNIDQVRATLRHATQYHEPEISWITLPPPTLEPSGTSFQFRAPGPLPVSRLAVGWAQDNTVAQVQVYSRDAESAPWQLRAGYTAFRVRDGDALIDSDDVGVSPNRDRHWRIDVFPAGAAQPNLRLGYRPDAFALLAQGAGPFVLAAGSRAAGAANYPMTSLLGALRLQSGGDWNLPDVLLGAEQVISGAAATDEQRSVPWRKWLLWIVLFAGVALIGGMVMKLLREQQDVR